MARCQCAGSSCSCLIQGGPGTVVTGVGTANQPYVVSAVPNVYDVVINAASPVYRINETFTSEVGARSVYNVEIDPAMTGYINLPDGSSAQPYPTPGAAIDVFVTGSISNSVVSFGGGVITWYGPAPVGSTLGWYRFVWKAGTINTWAGQFTPFR